MLTLLGNRSLPGILLTTIVFKIVPPATLTLGPHQRSLVVIGNSQKLYVIFSYLLFSAIQFWHYFLLLHIPIKNELRFVHSFTWNSSYSLYSTRTN